MPDDYKGLVRSFDVSEHDDARYVFPGTTRHLEELVLIPAKDFAVIVTTEYHIVLRRKYPNE